MIKQNLKKGLKEGAQFTDDLREAFPKYFIKSFLPIKKKNNNEFLFFKYFTDDGKRDDEGNPLILSVLTVHCSCN
jgi:hypothetical protein